MTIISEEGTKVEIKNEVNKIMELLDLKLPEGYFIDFEERTIYQKRRFLSPVAIAEFRVDWNNKTVTVVFEDEDDYDKLFDCFKDGNSKTNFHIKINDGFNY